jgi:hypothetical protein
MGTGVRHIDRYKTEVCLVTSGTGTGGSLWIDLQYYSHVTFFIATSNSTGTPAATYTFYQALTSGGSSSKVLSVNNYFYCSGGFGTQSSSADSWKQSSSGITGGSFAAISTVSTLFGYAVEIQDTDLDLNNSFQYVQVSATGCSSITQAIWAHLWPRFDGNFAALPTALT